jgi:hypothetical protein
MDIEGFEGNRTSDHKEVQNRERDKKNVRRHE